MKKLKIFDSSYFIGKSHFEEDGTQNCLVFQPMYRYFKRIAGVGSGDYIYYWKSKGLSDERINSITTSNYSITPNLDYYGTKTKVINIYTVCKLGASGSNDNDPRLKNSLFGAVRLTKNADIDKYQYSGSGIGFDRRSNFSFPSGRFGQNVIIFDVNMSSSIHVDNKKKRYFNSWKRSNTRIRTYTDCRKN